LAIIEEEESDAQRPANHDGPIRPVHGGKLPVEPLPEGTLTQTFTYIQLFTMVWLIWELCPRERELTRLMQAYILGTFVCGIDTVYLYLSHQESVYQRYAGAGLDANDLGLIMALSIPFSYYLLIQNKGRMVWVYRLQLVLAGTTILLTASRGPPWRLLSPCLSCP